MFSSDWGLPLATRRRASRLLWRWLEEDCNTPDAATPRETLVRAIVARR